MGVPLGCSREKKFVSEATDGPDPGQIAATGVAGVSAKPEQDPVARRMAARDTRARRSGVARLT